MYLLHHNIFPTIVTGFATVNAQILVSNVRLRDFMAQNAYVKFYDRHSHIASSCGSDGSFRFFLLFSHLVGIRTYFYRGVFRFLSRFANYTIQNFK